MAAIQQVLLAGRNRVYSWLNYEIENTIVKPTWLSVALDDSGVKGVASTTVDGGGIYITDDGGVTWKAAPFGNPSSGYTVSMSSDGSKILACSSGLRLSYSDDSGVSSRLLGSMASGWTNACMADDASVIMACGNGFILVSTNLGVNYTPRDSNRLWQKISCSATGQYAIACESTGFLYVSNDFGVTWAPKLTDSSRAWGSVTCSKDGMCHFAVANNLAVYLSTDYGNTWTESTSGTNPVWSSVSCSSDGNIVVVAGSSQAGSGYIMRGIKSGATSYSWNVIFQGGASVNGVSCSGNGNFTLLARPTSPIYLFNTFTYSSGVTSCPPRNWKSDATSSAGDIIYAVNDSDRVYKSTDFGFIWNEIGTVKGFRKICCSSNASVVAAITTSNRIIVSTDSGANWAVRDSVRNWSDIACSSLGSAMIASVLGGQLYNSVNSGGAWTARETVRNWSCVSISSNGSFQIAGVDGGTISSSVNTGTSWTIRNSSNFWKVIRCSDNGTPTYAAGNSQTGIGRINIEFSSFTTGTFVSINSPSLNWVDISVSADGKSLIGCSSNSNSVYFSRDGGINWNSIGIGDPSLPLSLVYMSKNSRKIFVGQQGGYLYSNVI